MNLISQIPPPDRPDIGPVEMPDPLPDPWQIWIWIGVGLLVVAAVAVVIVALVMILSRKKNRIRTAESVALQNLAELERDAGDFPPNEFSQKISDVLKDFVSTRFQDPLKYETADEFLQRHAGDDSKITHDVRTGLAEFLTIAEEIKFGLPPDRERRKMPLLDKAKSIVETQRQIMRAQAEAARRKK